ncbi:MAG: hypothetical protein KME11_04810 [Timaviella obliquedivisa GSE-PSE-MK23-08B]|jgi:hypothetical protein|nr:hypothetical protein [Timaviella obliquedivisa GSE-PSE-MK23-08B]
MLGNIIDTVQGLISPQMREYNKALREHQSGGRMGGRGTGWEAQYGLPSLDELTATEERDNRNWLIKLAIVSSLTFTTFLSQSFPGSLKTASLFCATVLSGVFYLQEQSQGLRERRRSLFNLAELRKDRRQHAATHQQVFDRKIADIRSYNRLIALGNTLPVGQRMALFQELGLEGWVPEKWVPVQARSSNPQFLGELPNQSLELPGNNVDPVQAAGAIYREALGKHGERNNFFFLGGMGDAKTSTAHFMLWNYINDAILTAHGSNGAISPPVIIVFDPHYGRNNNVKFLSTWCGLPRVKALPRNLENCAFKGSSETLLPFLQLVADEFEYRKKNDLAPDERPPILAVIDEFSNLMMELEVETQAEIGKIFRKLGTESRKFGVNYWIVGHSCTKGEIGLDRVVLRGCAAIVGYKILTDSSQISNLPHKLLDSGVAEVSDRNLRGLKLTGFATSLGESPYIPPSPLNTIEMEFKWGAAGQPVGEEPPAAEESDDRGISKEADEESPRESMKRLREALVAMRQWWDVQPGNPTDEQVVILWSRFSGDPAAAAKDSLVQIRGVMGLSQEVFDQRIENMKRQEEQMDG